MGYLLAMASTFQGLVRGMVAGAAGVTALNAVTYLDMLARGRPASETPQQLVETLAEDVGATIPGTGEERDNRLQALGPLVGLLTGTAVGAVAGAIRAQGIRLPTIVAAPLIGGVAMATADVPLAVTGISDPSTWKRADWLADALPHLVYGLVVHSTLAALD